MARRFFFLNKKNSSKLLWHFINSFSDKSQSGKKSHKQPTTNTGDEENTRACEKKVSHRCDCFIVPPKKLGPTKP